MHVIFNCLIHQEYQNEHTSQGAEVMFGERYVYVYNLLVMHGSIPAVTIPLPGNTPGICIFFARM
jgi:hypothetical protein